MSAWLWIAVTSTPCCRSVLATAFTSLSISTKSPVIAAFPSLVGWKFITVTTPMAGSNGWPISVIASARGAVTWKTPAPTSRPERPSACSMAFVSRVVPPRRGRSGCRAAEWRAARGQRLAEGARHLQGVAVSAVMHVHRVRRHLVQMVVDRRHLEAARKQPGHDRRDLLIEQDEVAHDHGVVTDLLERRVRAQSEARLHRNTLHRDVEIGAGYADAEDVAGLHLA